MSHPLDIVKVRPNKWCALSEKGQLHTWPQTFLTTRERAATLSCQIIEVVEAHKEKQSGVVVERRKLRGFNRVQPQSPNRAG